MNRSEKVRWYIDMRTQSLRQGYAKPLHLNTATFFLKKKELPRAGLEPTQIREREGAMEERGRERKNGGMMKRRE